MKGIVIKNSKDVLIHDNVFENLEVAIEAENVSGLWLKGNKIIYRDKRVDKLIKSIVSSNLSPFDQKIFIKEIIEALILGQKRALSSDKKKKALEKISRVFGKGVVEIIKELLAEVLAGKILLRV